MSPRRSKSLRGSIRDWPMQRIGKERPHGLRAEAARGRARRPPHPPFWKPKNSLGRLSRSACALAATLRACGRDRMRRLGSKEAGASIEMLARSRRDASVMSAVEAIAL